MKMIIAIIRDEDSEGVSQALVKSDFRVTRIASTGGFLRRGSTTFVIGAAEDKIEEAIQIIRLNCTADVEPGTNRATLFVIQVSNFEQL